MENEFEILEQYIGEVENILNNYEYSENSFNEISAKYSVVNIFSKFNICESNIIELKKYQNDLIKRSSELNDKNNKLDEEVEKLRQLLYDSAMNPQETPESDRDTLFDSIEKIEKRCFIFLYFFKNTEYIVKRINEKVKGYEQKPEIKITSSKIKTPKMNDLNKPSLNQVQISILFRILKEKRIVNNRDIDKIDYSKIISQLTGYSENTLRQNFSKENIMISDNPKDYEEIIVKLNEVIKAIETEKNNISNKSK
jgi:hypothetical protein